MQKSCKNPARGRRPIHPSHLTGCQSAAGRLKPAWGEGEQLKIKNSSQARRVLTFHWALGVLGAAHRCSPTPCCPLRSSLSLGGCGCRGSAPLGDQQVHLGKGRGLDAGRALLSRCHPRRQCQPPGDGCSGLILGVRLAACHSLEPKPGALCPGGGMGKVCIWRGGKRQEVPAAALLGQRLGEAGKGNFVPDLPRVQPFGVTTLPGLTWPEKP